MEVRGGLEPCKRCSCEFIAITRKVFVRLGDNGEPFSTLYEPTTFLQIRIKATRDGIKRRQGGPKYCPSGLIVCNWRFDLLAVKNAVVEFRPCVICPPKPEDLAAYCVFQDVRLTECGKDVLGPALLLDIAQTLEVLLRRRRPEEPGKVDRVDVDDLLIGGCPYLGYFEHLAGLGVPGLWRETVVFFKEVVAL